MLRRWMVIVLVLLLSNCSACWDIRELNMTAVCTAAGVELSPSGEYLFTGQLLKPGAPDENGSQTSRTTVLSARGSAVADAGRRFMLSLGRLPEWPSISTFVIGENLAQKDLALLCDFLLRNRNIRPTSNLLLSKGCCPEEVLSFPMPLTSYTGEDLKIILELQEKQLGIYVPTDMHEFLRKLSMPGIDPVIPQLAIEGEKLFINGTAVFKERRMVGVLNEQESRGYRWLNGRCANGGMIEINFPKRPDEVVSLEIRQFYSKITPQVDEGELKMKVIVKVELSFYEQSKSGELLNLSGKKELEELAAREIKREITACIEKAQFLGSDILGWGYILQKRQPELWKQYAAEWTDIYPAIASDIEVETLLLSLMLSQKSFRFR